MGKLNLCISNIIRFVAFTREIMLMVLDQQFSYFTLISVSEVNTADK